MIQKLTTEYRESVIDLHTKVLGHTLNSKIGHWFLRKLYMITSDCADNGFCYVFIHDGRVVGFISFCLDHVRLEKEIMAQLRFFEKMKIVWFLLTHPWLLPLFFRQQYFGRYLKNNFSQPYASILTLGVNPETQGQGIGKQLLNTTKDIVRSKHIQELFVDTEETNTKAVAFYQKNDFQQASIISGNIVLKCLL